MTKTPTKNIPASIIGKLKNIQRKSGEDFNFILRRYASERFLYRLGLSKHSKSFVPKGALLYIAWGTKKYRPTQDIDFLKYGDNSIETLESIIREVCQVKVDEYAGISFKPNSVKGELIKEGQQYEGVRIKLQGTLGKILLPLQLDIGFGDEITPGPTSLKLPILLDHISPPKDYGLQHGNLDCRKI